MRGAVLAAIFLALNTCIAARAQEAQRESIEIGLSTDRIAINADFSGADLTIFGALDNADPLVMRHGRYDIIVVLEGPARNTVVRRKERVFGMWMNTSSEVFANVPESYSLATTRAIQDITSDENFRRLSLGADFIFIQPISQEGDAARISEFTQALRNRKKEDGLYSERIGGVRFLSQSLFRATLALPPSVPVGSHRARAFLFKNGTFLTETSAPLLILKSGLEETIHFAAIQYGFFYGIGAVVLAILTGWIGRVIFRKD